MAATRIFVSHSHQDDEFGVRLVTDLRHAMQSDDAVWYDASGGLQPGDPWWTRIREELRSRPVFIVVVSPASMESPWVNNEVDLAWMLRNSLGGKTIIPILYQPCNVRDDLKILHTISFLPPRSYETAFADLLASISLAERSGFRSAGPKPLDASGPLAAIGAKDAVQESRHSLTIGRRGLLGTLGCASLIVALLAALLTGALQLGRTSSSSETHPRTQLPAGTATVTQGTPAVQVLLQQSAPGCNNQVGVTWEVRNASPEGNNIGCVDLGNGDTVTQLFETTAFTPEELLITTSAGVYDDNRLQVAAVVQYVDVSGNVSASGATLRVHAPADRSVCGGYMFIVFPTGKWDFSLLHANSCAVMSLQTGTYSGGPASSYRLSVSILNGSVSAYINDNQVFTLIDTLQGGLCGIMLRTAGALPVRAYFQAFEVSQQS